MKAPDNGGSSRVDVRFWGTRGSVPSPGPGTVAFGGNTSCVEVQWNGLRIVLDGGTGLRSLGTLITTEGGGATQGSVGVKVDKSSCSPGKSALILLSHYHWDHVQGLPFFSPLYDPDTRLTVVGPGGSGFGVRDLLDRLLSPNHFPVPREHLKAEIALVGVESSPVDQLDLTSGYPGSDKLLKIATYPCRHGGDTIAYRLDLGGCRICYAPDNELVGGSYDVPVGWTSGFEDFVAGADLLIHDAMFTEEEYPRVEGWGHSTFHQATDLALRAEVRHLVFFHHAPDRSDGAISQQVEEQRRYLDGLQNTALVVSAAREGETVSFMPRQPR